MELWNTLAAITPDFTARNIACIAGLALAVAIGAYAVARGKTTAQWQSSVLFVSFLFAVMGALPGSALMSVMAHEEVAAARADAIADYLADEHALLVLDPVEMDRMNDQAVAVAFTADDELVDVTVRWLDFDAKPHSPERTLPGDFDPITVTIVPRTSE